MFGCGSECERGGLLGLARHVVFHDVVLMFLQQIRSVSYRHSCYKVLDIGTTRHGHGNSKVLDIGFDIATAGYWT